MPNQNYKRTIKELRGFASMFWPSELSQKEAELSVIPKLLETQERFIAILSVEVPDLNGLFQVINSSTLSANMLLKHLVVLADFGGEMLQRVNSQFAPLFPSGKLDYLWNGQQYSYHFKNLPVSSTLNNDKLGISGKKLLEKRPLSDLLKDVVALLLFGSACVDENVANVLTKCEVGNYLGHPEKIEQFIKQRYVWVSRITGGSQANNLGQIAQKFVKEYLQANLGIEHVDIRPNGHLPGVTHTDAKINRPTTFDLVISRGNKYVAVEVSFQVTTNSTIERKAGQAKSRFEQVEASGYKIAYVIDGAGNFERESAIRTLCSYSHCTVAFSRAELDVLCEFLKGYFKTPDSP